VSSGGQDPAPSGGTPRSRLRAVGLGAAALGVVALVTVGALAVVRPHVESTAGSSGGPGLSALAGSSTPTPVAGPITPATHPYDELAILRRQRLSTDVLPKTAFTDADTGDGSPTLVTASARLLATSGKERAFLVVDSEGGVCIVQTTDRDTGGSTGCSSPGGDDAPGSVVGGIGTGSGLDFTVIADGTPKPGTTDGYRQIAPNVWLAKTSHAVPAPAPASSVGDPLAFPAVAPYSRFAILRRAASPSDLIPAALTSTSGTVIESVLLSSTRLAGTYLGTTVWIGATPSGDVCMILDETATDGLSSACGSPTSGVGVAAGDNGSGGDFELVTDSADRGSRAGGEDSRRLAPNVWVSPPSK
jgi:hypothetical protein